MAVGSKVRSASGDSSANRDARRHRGSRGDLAGSAAAFLTVGFLLSVALLLSAALSRPAAGGAIPPNAAAEAIGAPVELVDGPVLVFAFPALAAVHPGQLLGIVRGSRYDLYGSGYFEDYGAAALMPVGSQKLFLASRTFMSDAGISGASSSSNPEVQIGWAAGGPSLRFGAAVRGRIERAESTDLSESWRNPRETYSATDKRRHDLWAAVGLGSGGDRWAIDGSAELRWRSWKIGAGTYADSPPTPLEVSLFTFQEDENPHLGLRLRTRIPLGAEARLLAAGSWRGGEQRWSAYFYGDAAGVPVDSLARLRRYEDAWTAALGVQTPLAAVDRILLTASYGSERLPTLDAGYGDAVRSGRTLRVGRVSAGLEDRIRRDLMARGGVEVSYRYDRRLHEELDPGYGLRISSDVSESMDHAFTAGLGWARGRLRLDGALNTTVRFDAPFYAVDISYRFGS